MSVASTAKVICKWHGCNRDATCLPRIYVPPSMFSQNHAADDASALMGMPLCDRCFKQIKAADLLAGENGVPIRQQITDVFRRRNAYPNFDKAVVGRVSRFDTDWKVYLQMVEKARRVN